LKARSREEFVCEAPCRTGLHGTAAGLYLAKATHPTPIAKEVPQYLEANGYCSDLFVNRTTRSVVASVVGLTITASASCKASYPLAPTDPSPVAFWVHYWTPVGIGSVGGLYAFSAFILASDGAYEDVTARATWVESDSQVLRRSGSGLFPSAVAYSAVAPGNVEVAAQYEGLTSSISMSVIRPERQPFPNLMITPVGAALGRSTQSVLRWRENAAASEVVTDLASWESSNTRVVTVDRGLITAVAPGTAQITASYNGQVAWYGLSVLPLSK
jgi:hypothetical protein